MSRADPVGSVESGEDADEIKAKDGPASRWSQPRTSATQIIVIVFNRKSSTLATIRPQRFVGGLRTGILPVILNLNSIEN